MSSRPLATGLESGPSLLSDGDSGMWSLCLTPQGGWHSHCLKEASSPIYFPPNWTVKPPGTHTASSNLLSYASIFKNHARYIMIHQFRNTYFSHAPFPSFMMISTLLSSSQTTSLPRAVDDLIYPVRCEFMNLEKVTRHSIAFQTETCKTCLQ